MDANVGKRKLLHHNGAMQRDAESSGSVQPDLDIEPRFYTLDQTARYLNVSQPQVYALVRSGELPAVKIGGRGVWRVDRRQLEAYIERLLEETREWAKAHPHGLRSDSGKKRAAIR
jgi:excisionase family DNA binding protein